MNRTPALVLLCLTMLWPATGWSQRIDGRGSFRLPNTNQWIRYRVNATKCTNSNDGAKFLLRLANTNANSVRLIVCAMLDLKDKGMVEQPDFRISKENGTWSCTNVGTTEAFYNYHFGCKRVTIPAATAQVPEQEVAVFKDSIKFSTEFDRANLGTVYMDFLIDCPIAPNCDQLVKADMFLRPEFPSDRKLWVNAWVGGEYFPVAPIPSDLMFSHNPVTVPSGNWVTMGYPASYPARVLGTLRGAPAGSHLVVSFDGQARPSYPVPPAPGGGETVVSVDELFTIPVHPAYDTLDLVIPVLLTNTISEGQTVSFNGQVFAEAGAPHYAPGDLMYVWDVQWTHDNLPPTVLYHSVTQFGDGVRAQLEVRDMTSTPIEALLAYHSPETGSNKVEIAFSDPPTQGDIVHFASQLKGLPYGIELGYRLEVYDVMGNRTVTPEETLYLFGAGLSIQRDGDNVKLSWTTSEPNAPLAFNPTLDGRNLWRVANVTPAFHQGVYSVSLPILNAPRFFQINGQLEQPCAGGELLVRQAYSECNPDGFWHVVEDNYYACPPNGEVKRFRVGDIKTEQRCGPGQPRVAVAGNLYRQLEGDETCRSPILIGEIRILECVADFWEIAIYNLYECLDGTRRISIPPKDRTRTNTPCTEPPPPPNVI